MKSKKSSSQWLETWLDLTWLAMAYFKLVTWLDLTCNGVSQIGDLIWLDLTLFDKWLDLTEKIADLSISDSFINYLN